MILPVLIWESQAVGSSGPNYLNSTALIHTDLSLESIKSTIISPIENQLGRIRTEDKYIDRTIDLDVLIYNDRVVDPELWTQAHLAVPASELLPDFMNTTTGETLLEIAAELGERIEIIQRIDLD
jgi:2-amino-4-hydroxy-6-hydroxymethyldihydropteridine diphosphokinase